MIFTSPCPEDEKPPERMDQVCTTIKKHKFECSLLSFGSEDMLIMHGANNGINDDRSMESRVPVQNYDLDCSTPCAEEPGRMGTSNARTW